MGIATHELLHAIGMTHEHQRPDRDSYIKVNVANLKDKGLENINSKHDISDLAEKSTFDYGSIMMYPNYTGDTDFVNNTSEPMFWLLKPYSGVVGQRDGLSTLDIQTINLRYK